MLYPQNGDRIVAIHSVTSLQASPYVYCKNTQKRLFYFFSAGSHICSEINIAKKHVFYFGGSQLVK